MSEPLKGKIMYEMLVYSDNTNFGNRDKVIKQWQDFAKDIKSALEWMIERHEEKIDELILTLENQPLVGGMWVEQGKMFREIKANYKSIMILEEGLSDVV